LSLRIPSRIIAVFALRGSIMSLNRTPLFSEHQALGAHCVDFAGWEMPLHYGSQLKEHHAVRQKVGVFDVSHMGVIDLTGPDVIPFAQKLFCSDVGSLVPEQALYTCLLNPEGGIVDDLIVYMISKHHLCLVVNAGTQAGDFLWILSHSKGFDVEVARRSRTAIIALQGPESHLLLSLCPPALKEKVKALKPFHFVEYEGWLIAATGYTGEKGYEILLPYEAVISFWKQLMERGVVPCGLGSRDTLRLEAGLPLYGSDMNTSISPWVTGLSWTVHLAEGRDFIGRSALTAMKEKGITEAFVGLILKDKGVLRNGLPIFNGDEPVGVITSGGFSPTMNCSIALARVHKPIPSHLTAELRGKRLSVEVMKPNFVRHGKVVAKTWA
jgi:aminomethyltransferase